MDVRRIKGDARMGELLRRALEGRRRTLDDDVSLRVRFARATLARGAGQRTRGVDRGPSCPLQGRPARVAIPSRQRGAPGVPLVGPSGCRRDLVRGRAHLDRRVRRPPRHPVARRLPHRARPRAALLTGPARALLRRPPDRGRAAAAAPGPRRHGRVDGMERRRPRPPRRGRLPDRRSDPHLRPHRRRRGAGPHADAVPHDRPARPLGVDHRAGRPGAGHGTLDLRGLGRGAGPPARSGSAPSRRADARLPRPGTGARLRVPAPARGGARGGPHLVHPRWPHRPGRPCRAGRGAGPGRTGRGPAPGRASTPWWR